MHTNKILAVACVAASFTALAASNRVSALEKALSSKVLHAGVRSSYRIVQHEILADGVFDLALQAVQVR